MSTFQYPVSVCIHNLHSEDTKNYFELLPIINSITGKILDLDLWQSGDRKSAKLTLLHKEDALNIYCKYNYAPLGPNRQLRVIFQPAHREIVLRNLPLGVSVEQVKTELSEYIQAQNIVHARIQPSFLRSNCCECVIQLDSVEKANKALDMFTKHRIRICSRVMRADFGTIRGDFRTLVVEFTHQPTMVQLMLFFNQPYALLRRYEIRGKMAYIRYQNVRAAVDVHSFYKKLRKPHYLDISGPGVIQVCWP